MEMALSRFSTTIQVYFTSQFIGMTMATFSLAPAPRQTVELARVLDSMSTLLGREGLARHWAMLNILQLSEQLLCQLRENLRQTLFSCRLALTLQRDIQRR